MREDVQDAAVDDLLVEGGDDRLPPGPDGLNKYGCAARPRDELNLGSCTASSVTPRGRLAAGAAWAEIRERCRLEPPAWVADCECAAIRQALLDWLGLDRRAVDLVLSPSGTDAELAALSLLAARGPEPISSIVVGPREIGSGSLLAAGGCHFTSRTPDGAAVRVGAPVDEPLAARVQTRSIGLRLDCGNARAADDLDEAVAAGVREGLDGGRRVLIHIVAHSKTGVHAPRLETAIDQANRYGARVMLLADAAQGRIGRRRVREFVERGAMVILTGSKFFGGPAFSGALLVPRTLSAGHPHGPALPAGLASYLTAADLPETWKAGRATLGARVNFGLVLRWRAALAEITAYQAVEASARNAVFRFFEAESMRRLAACRHVTVLDEPAGVPGAMRTVLCLAVRRMNGTRVEADGLKRLACLLNRDLSAESSGLGAADARAAARQIHVGQPVIVGASADGRETAVLRIALGAPLVTEVATAPDRGSRLAERLDWLGGQLDVLKRKIELVIESGRWGAL